MNWVGFKQGVFLGGTEPEYGIFSELGGRERCMWCGGGGCWDGMSSGTRESCKSRCYRTSKVQSFRPINTFIRTVNLVVFYYLSSFFSQGKHLIEAVKYVYTFMPAKNSVHLL